ncbi:MAG: cyclopropane-fatty-acyl-phospholipid synthase family protein [Gammaproteobacteria bacterium]
MTRRKDQPAAGTAGFLGVPSLRHTASGTIPAMAPPAWIERRVLRKLLALMGNPPVQFVLWNGAQVPATGSPECRRLHINDRHTLWQLVINPDLHFGDAYSRGTLDIEGDLTGFIESLNRSRQDAGRQNRLFSNLLSRRNRAHPNTLAGSRSNIHHHYNLGNEFFQLWLDEEMVYTCAYFPTNTLTLEQAQLAKLDYVCRKLRLQPGDTVIEAGCGWGALARHMARKYGARVRAFNLSAEQIRYARNRAAAEGIGRNVEYIEDDYRNISGKCDVFVSIGMLEHVGRDNYRSLGGIIDRCLAPDGRGLIHSIGRNQPCPMNAWIERRVFPGSYPPTLREMMEIFEPWEFSVLDVENLRLHYARTLEHWLARFEAHRDEVREHFDEDFVRAWRLYLAGSLAGFTTGWLQLFQVVFTRAGNNSIPWSREHLYAHRS